eukprot:NODE_674_length_2192_cov_96.617206_g644_i0.p1 GENE.NODE_674_length_2192_cov_96.617206_g644_i0~~NODE_674_length_2192_cov_96.617206_g644_i0.p1  ORF type:complete len:669 (+),score=94.20 NODE_674_length_2192_cov_96.617206_g644_i0:80-2086(+)
MRSSASWAFARRVDQLRRRRLWTSGGALLAALFTSCVAFYLNSMYIQVDMQLVVMFAAAELYLFSSMNLALSYPWATPIPLVVALVACAVMYSAAESSPTKLSDQFAAILFGAFVCLVFLGSGIALLIMKWARRYLWSIRRGLAAISLALCSIIYFVYSLLDAPHSNMAEGLFGSQMDATDNHPQCPIPNGLTPWSAWMPLGAGNLFLGSKKCSTVRNFSWLVAPGVLEYDCPEGGHVRTGYDHFPRNTHFHKLRRFHAKAGRTTTTPFPNSQGKLAVQAEWFEAFCGRDANFHANHIPAPQVIEAAQHAKRASNGLNVLLFMFDSLSRLQFLRRMPKTVGLLERIQQHGPAQSFQFFRYTVVGGSTFDNAPLFMGGDFDHPSFSFSEMNYSDPRYDRYWWVDFKKLHGFATLFQSDICEEDLASWLNGAGFHLDHHFVAWSCHPEYDAHGHWTNFVGPYSLRRRCIDGKMVHAYNLDFLKQAWENYAVAGVGRAAHVSFDENHEGLGEVLNSMDDDFASFLEWMWQAGHLENTVVILTADHGVHMGPYFLTKAGRLEHKLPLLIMTMPRAFLAQHPELQPILKHNEQLPLTAWDLHATLRHLATYPEKPHAGEPGFPRGPPWQHSLLTKLPLHRTCEDMRIPRCRCVCGDQWMEYQPSEVCKAWERK